ncbi:ABC transporter permease/M1 family aminopeptidase [Acanthopleuribacter pedis]|uniref:Peptidase M1 membrane alanine aminopeptidase domain-containing protein n=1 Tax=Acanthopleuribacter pedis TaxID=442870 RepID=A0A8J7Q2P6_9BACT|nr:M1 family aminopeptidase [Acanthopleuribacter pedis]MBO1319462.1 hypothetical protein [Acanthopleuribacter pedis]
MLLETLKFEWRFYHARHLLGLGAFIFFLLGFAMTGRVGSGAGSLLNAPYALIPIYQLLSLAAVVIIAVFAGIAVLRDHHHDCEALVFTTGLGKNRFLAARWLGLVLVSFAVFACASLGIMLRTLLPHGLHGNFAANDPWVHGRILLTIALPNILLIASLLFAVALRTRNAMATCAAGMALYVLYLLCSALVGSPLMAGEAAVAGPDARFWAALLDPLGTSAFFEDTAAWTRLQRDSVFPAWDGLIRGNRLLWSAVTALILIYVWRTDPFRQTASVAFGLKRRTVAAVQVSAGDGLVAETLIAETLIAETLIAETLIADRAAAPAYRPLQPQFGCSQWFRAWLSCLCLDALYLVKSFPFWVLMGLWAALLLGEIAPIGRPYPFTAPSLPLTAVVLERFQFDLLPGFGVFLILFYSGDLARREDAHPMHPLSATTATPHTVFFFAKLGLLCLIPLALITVAVMVGVGFQISQGWFRFDWALYGSLYLYGGVPLCLAAVPCLVLQTLSPNKYVGLLAAAAFLLFFSTGLCAMVGLEHPMWRFAAVPGYQYSDMSGYGYFPEAFWHYTLFWSALAGAMLLPASALNRREKSVPLLMRLRALPARLKRRERWAVAGCLLLFVLVGGRIGYLTNVVGAYRTADETELIRVAYEQSYRHFTDLKQPTLQAVKTEMAIYPRQGRYSLQAEYRLTNPHGEALSALLLTVNPNLVVRDLALKGARFETDAAVPGAYAAQLTLPFQPGETRVLTFSIEHRTTAFTRIGGRHQVAPNGTLIHGAAHFPTLGYLPDRELQDPMRRASHGLGDPTPPRTAAHAEKDPGGGDFVQFETLVSTSDDQTAVAPGRLIGHGVEAGRAWFHYRGEAPMRDGVPYLSATYAAQNRNIAGYEVTLLYHPDHSFNTDSIWEGIEAALRYGTRRFGPLPQPRLRFAEVPNTTGISGYAGPGLVLMGEFSGFNHDLSNQTGMNQVFRRTVHETAHQWWGHLVAPAAVDEGAMLLVETLAKYTELMLLEQTAGIEQTHRFVDHEVERYFRARVREPEMEHPLSRVRGDQAYVMYAKGAAAMNALRHRIGEPAVNRALRQLVGDHAHPGPAATAEDLIRMLVAEAPDQADFIREWLTEVVFYRSVVERVTLTPLPDGQVALEVICDLSKVRHADDGRDHETAFSQPVTWSVTLGEGDAAQTMTKRFPMQNGTNRLGWILPGAPTRITFDPKRELLDEQRHSTKGALAKPFGG